MDNGNLGGMKGKEKWMVVILGALGAKNSVVVLDGREDCLPLILTTGVLIMVLPLSPPLHTVKSLSVSQ